MKKALIIITCLIINIVSAQEDTTTIYLIRHAEQADLQDKGLSEEGKEQAKKWVAYFKDKNIDTYYITKDKRIIYTATTIGSYNIKGGEPGTTETFFNFRGYDPNDLLLKNVAEDHKGENVLIVGYRNTIPKQINTLLGTDEFADISENEYGNLYIITIKDGNTEIETARL